MPPISKPSPVPADPLARLGLTAEELDARYAREVALCVQYDGDSAKELAEHELRAEDE